jgi:hypothetical protein
MAMQLNFDADRAYAPNEVRERTGFAEQTLAKWRCLGAGPAYLKIGGRVFYCGSALNAWIASAERGGIPSREVD